MLCVSAFFTPPFVLEVLRARKHKIVMLFTESPYQDDMQLKMAEYATLSLVNDPQNIGRYRESARRSTCRTATGHRSTTRPRPARNRRTTSRSSAPGSRQGRVLRGINLDGLDVVLGGFWGTAAADSPLRQHLISRQDGEDACVDNADAADLYGPRAPGSTCSSARPRTRGTSRPGPRDPARSRSPRADCRSPATACRMRQLFPCSRRSPARKKQASRSGGARAPRAAGRGSGKGPRGHRG